MTLWRGICFGASLAVRDSQRHFTWLSIVDIPVLNQKAGTDHQLCRDRFTGTPAVAVPLSHIKILLSKSRTMTANEFLLLKMKLPDRMGGNGAAFVQIIWVCRGGW